MAINSKKCRRTIGSMLDPDFENNSENDTDLESSGPDSDNPSGRDSSDDEEPNHDRENNQELVTRGHAKQTFEWGTGKVLLLSLDNKNRVIGNNAAMFSSQLGILAKDGNKFPLTYTDWRAVPHTQKNMAWDEVKENTNLTESYKSNCMKKLGKVWKDWKNRVKARHFNPNKHDKSVLLATHPARVEADQWPMLVNYWLSKKAKAISKKNKNSRKNIKFPVRLGRKDMANATEEVRQTTGMEPSDAHMFIHSRKRKTGKPLDKLSGEKIARIEELQEQLPDHLKDDIEANNEIYENVVGKEVPGCLRSCRDPSKGKNLIFTTREELDRVVQQKSSAEVANIQRNFEEELNKLKDDYNSKMEMLQTRLNTIENQNVHVPGSSNSRRVVAPNGGLSSQETNNSETSQPNKNIEITKEISTSGGNATNVSRGTSSSKEKEKREQPRRSMRKAT